MSTSVRTRHRRLPPSGGYYYNDTTGFVGRVVEANGKIFVVFRGTDLAGSLSDIVSAKLGFQKTPGVVDIKDYDYANIALGWGTTGTSQLNDALALTRAAEAVAQQTGKQVVVAGQSLGGGLAGLVSVIEGIKGYGIAPAPFQNQLDVEARLLAMSGTIADPAHQGKLKPAFEALSFSNKMQALFVLSDQLFVQTYLNSGFDNLNTLYALRSTFLQKEKIAQDNFAGIPPVAAALWIA